MKSKWFKFDGKYFESKRRARTINQAWDKTLEKWPLIMKGRYDNSGVETCGLCNLYESHSCENCPIATMTGKILCRSTPLNRDPDLEYLFLLIVKEATKC